MGSAKNPNQQQLHDAQPGVCDPVRRETGTADSGNVGKCKASGGGWRGTDSFGLHDGPLFPGMSTASGPDYERIGGDPPPNGEPLCFGHRGRVPVHGGGNGNWNLGKGAVWVLCALPG